MGGNIYTDLQTVTNGIGYFVWVLYITWLVISWTSRFWVFHLV